MDEHAEQWVAIVDGLDEARANELALVLIARGIEHQRQRGSRGVELWVPVASATAAAHELGQYRRENARRAGSRPLEHVAGSAPGVLAYVGVLLAVFVAGHESLFGLDWYGAGLLRASTVTAGELWRAVTALTLHIEPDHLAGNLVFGAFFGGFVARYLGVGVGWLAVVAAGAAANLLGAWLAAPDHRSLGASTAVFAAVAMLAAFTWRLLAFIGTGGENTDIGAHLLGFCAGFATGLGFARRLAPATLRNTRLQRGCAAAALGMVVAAWAWGLLAAG
jgi:rhomboid protease GluP